MTANLMSIFRFTWAGWREAICLALIKVPGRVAERLHGSSFRYPYQADLMMLAEYLAKIQPIFTRRHTPD